MKKEEKIIPVPEEVRPTFKKEFDYENGEKLLELKHVKQYFRFKGGNIKYLKAVHDVSFDVYKGEVFGLVGESGCGKTTTGRDIMRLYPITSGDILLKGNRISAGTRWNEKEIKWVTIRGKNRIEEIKKEKKAIADKIIAEYEEMYSQEIRLKALEKTDDPEKQVFWNRYKEAIAPLDEEIASIKAQIKKTHDEQIAEIKSAHYDNKHYNDATKAKEIALVKEKYPQFAEISSPDNLKEEEKELYKQYQQELSLAKKKTLSNEVQMIFQDPIASLNPRMTVRNIIAEGLVINGIKDKEYIDKEVARVLTLVGLVPEHATRYPHEFSGGQRQRIGIARAIIMNPELIVADEPVSALDVSVQAQVINLLNDLRESMGLTLVFIAHNLSVVKYFCDRIAVMYYGNLVELATSDELFAHPLHPYTKSLLSAVPYPDPVIEKNRVRITYDPSKEHDYSKELPTWREIAPGHFLRCNSEEEEKAKKELGL